MKRPVLILIGLISTVAALMATPPGGADIAAQEIHRPIVGSQFLVLGVEVQGGPILDWRGESLEASWATGPRGRIGLHHIVTPRLSMNAEFAPGATYFQAHPMAPEGAGDAQLRFDWRIGVLGRYMAIGPLSGWTFAGGLDYRQAHLRDGNLLQLGIDLRFGRHVWTDDERFFIVELGLHAPLIEGLSISDFSGEAAQTIPDQWSHPSLSLGIQWAF